MRGLREWKLFLVAAVLGILASTWLWMREGARESLPMAAALPLPVFASESCRKAYEAFYASDSVELRMVFGYKDARPARFVGDRYERAVFVQEILSPCGGADGACGFERSKEDADLFTKKIRGPDGKPRRIRLRVVQSSVGVDDEVNRSNPFQRWQSEYARKTFLQGLAGADGVIYDGHSRSGGGPDFEPPRLTSTRRVAMSWYRRTAPGLKSMELALSDAKAGVKMLGLFSCDSSPLFAPRVADLKESLGVVASDRLIYYADALQGSLAAISALLEMKCQPDFDLALKAKAGQAGAKLTGFFKD